MTCGYCNQPIIIETDGFPVGTLGFRRQSIWYHRACWEGMNKKKAEGDKEETKRHVEKLS